MGVSVEDQRVIHRVADLAKTPARIKFLSREPLIGPLADLALENIHWVIVGGESGPGARPMKTRVGAIDPKQMQRSADCFLFQTMGRRQKRPDRRLLQGETFDEMPRGHLNPMYETNHSGGAKGATYLEK